MLYVEIEHVNDDGELESELVPIDDYTVEIAPPTGEPDYALKEEPPF